MPEIDAAGLSQYRDQGFVNAGPLLSSEEVEELREELERVMRDRDDPARPQPVHIGCWGEGGPTELWQIVNIWMASEAFRRLVDHPRLVELAAALSEARELRLWHDQIQYKPHRRGGVNMWHQDWPYWANLDAPYQVTAWVALDDVDPENGCMSMVPGSHLWGNASEYLHALASFGDLRGEYQGHPITVTPCPVPAGHVHFHHALTWHGSPANTSGRPRRAIALHYMTEETRYRASGDHLLKPRITVPDGAPLTGDTFPRVWPRD